MGGKGRTFVTISEKFEERAKKADSLVCVGLDSDISRLPEGYDQLSFNKAIIDATHDLVLSYKPNSAFYEAVGADGMKVLKETCEYIRQVAPDVLIILDYKRADIGNTNNGYIKFAYEECGVDAVTLSPYLGSEALKPFLGLPDKGSIILCRTSNPGGGELQGLMVGDMMLYEKVAELVAKQWNSNNNCLLVVGATYPEEAAKIRQIVGDDMWFLVPGVGAQGGDIEKTITAAQNSRGDGIIINSSRGIIFASPDSNFAEAARQETEILRDEINKYRKGR